MGFNYTDSEVFQMGQNSLEREVRDLKNQVLKMQDETKKMRTELSELAKKVTARIGELKNGFIDRS